MEHDITITIILRASSPFINSLRASSSSGATKTAIQPAWKDSFLLTQYIKDDLEENDDREVAARYNTLSPSYDELYGQEQSPNHKAVIELIADEKFQILVDVGCGSGTFLKSAHELYEYAVGIDLSMSMLKIAKSRRSGKTDLILA